MWRRVVSNSVVVLVVSRAARALRFEMASVGQVAHALNRGLPPKAAGRAMTKTRNSTVSKGVVKDGNVGAAGDVRGSSRAAGSQLSNELGALPALHKSEGERDASVDLGCGCRKLLLRQRGVVRRVSAPADVLASRKHITWRNRVWQHAQGSAVQHAEAPKPMA